MTKLHLKVKGIVPSPVRATIRDLVVKAKVPYHWVQKVVSRVAALCGVEVRGSFSPRAVRRIVLEGGLAAAGKIIHAAKQSDGESLKSELLRCSC